MAPEPSGMDAVEGIDAATHAVKDVPYTTNTKQMNWPILSNPFSSIRDYIVHSFLVSAEAAANANTEKRMRITKRSAFISQVWVDPSLYNAIQCLPPYRMRTY